MKIALISNCLPPELSGQGIIIFRLLQNADPDSYCLISLQRYKKDKQNLSGKYYRLPKLKIIPSVEKIIRTIKIKDILIKEKINAVVACTGNISVWPMAYKVCKKLKIPFYVYIFDDYYYQNTSKSNKLYVKKTEKKILENANGIIVTNEFMKNELLQRYGINSTIIHNSCEIIEYIKNNEVKSITDKIILYTGSIYEAQANALSNLVSAIKQLNRNDVKLHLYTSCSKSKLDSVGITGPVVIHDNIHPDDMSNVQQNADILFLPLSFDSIYPELIKTTLPGKFGEYLTSKRPILANVPADSFIKYYISKYNCGVCVDKPDAGLLADAINDLLSDNKKCDTITGNAWKRANEDFNIEKSREIFDDLLNWHPERGIVNDKW